MDRYVAMKFLPQNFMVVSLTEEFHGSIHDYEISSSRFMAISLTWKFHGHNP